MKKELRKMKKFRFVLLHEWIVKNFAPCKVADIGGGKGMMSHLLNSSGFECTVIDPFDQLLLSKYKTLDGTKIKLEGDIKVKRINAPFESEMSQSYDLLLGMHAHGSNMKIIESAANYNKKFILLPCCVIDEPVVKKENVNWFESLEEYAHSLGIKTARFELNFKGQNVGFYSI